MSIVVTQPWSGLKVSRGDPRTAEVAFDVWFNGADNPGTAQGALDAVYSAYSIQQNSTAAVPESGSTQNYFCNQISAACSGFGVYRVSAMYSTTPRGHFNNPALPLSEPIEYLFQPASVSEPVDRDYYGNPIANANSDAFQSLPSKFFGIINLTIRWNSLSYDVAGLETYHNTVNSGTWTFGPGGTWSVAGGEAFCKGIMSMTEVTVDSPYVRLEGQWELKPPISGIDSDGLADSYKYRVLNAGRRCFFTDSVPKTRLGDIIYNGGMSNTLRVQDDVRLGTTGIPLLTESFAVQDALGTTQTPVANPNPCVGGTNQPIAESIIVGGVTVAVFLHYQLYTPVSYDGLSL